MSGYAPTFDRPPAQLEHSPAAVLGMSRVCRRVLCEFPVSDVMTLVFVYAGTHVIVVDTSIPAAINAVVASTGIGHWRQVARTGRAYVFEAVADEPGS